MQTRRAQRGWSAQLFLAARQRCVCVRVCYRYRARQPAPCTPMCERVLACALFDSMSFTTLLGRPMPCAPCFEVCFCVPVPRMPMMSATFCPDTILCDMYVGRHKQIKARESPRGERARQRVLGHLSCNLASLLAPIWYKPRPNVHTERTFDMIQCP